MNVGVVLWRQKPCIVCISSVSTFPIVNLVLILAKMNLTSFLKEEFSPSTSIK